MLPTPAVHRAAFPVISRTPFPDPALFDTSQDFRLRTANKGLDWVYHFAAQRRTDGGQTETRFRHVSREALVAQLDPLRREFGVEGEYLLRVEECFFGKNSGCGGGCTGTSYHPPVEWIGGSHQLALAVALYAAHTGEKVPSWALFSGAMRPDSIQTGRTGGLAAKVALALGREPGVRHLTPLVRLAYETGVRADTERCMGPLEARALPGESLRLLVVGRCDLAILPKRFPGAEPVEIRTGKYRGSSPATLLEAYANKDAHNGLLVVGVPSLREALSLLAMRPPGNEKKRLPGFRIPWSVAERPVSRPRRFHYLAGVVESMSNADPSHKAALQAVLRVCCYELQEQLSGQQARCFSGDVALISRDQPEMLHVEARWGKEADAIPYFYPGDVGITGTLLRDGETQDVEDTSERDDFAEAKSQDNSINRLYPADTFRRYVEFLCLIKSCVKVPIRDAGRIVGVLSLHCNQPAFFDEAGVKFLSSLAQLAAAPARALYDQPRNDLLGDERGSYRRVIRDSFTGDLVFHPGRFRDAWKRMCAELARLARARAGALRTAVRTLDRDPDGDWLRYESKDGDYPDEFMTRRHLVGRGAPSAANHAIQTLHHVYVEDTEKKDVPIELVGPPSGRAHASVLILFGSHILGVLSVDWREPRKIPLELREDLERLAGRYALGMKSILQDARHDESREKVDDLPAFARLAGELVGAQFVALYLRCDEDARYRLEPEGCSGHAPAWRERKRAGYAPGEGFVGWVARQGSPLRVADRRDAAELERFAGEGRPRPAWHSERGEFEDEWGDRVVAWMGVPVRGGGEILGVLRFAEHNGEEGFSAFDQTAAEFVASLLGERLYRDQQSTRQTALVEFAAEANALDAPGALCRRLFAALDRAIGRVSGGVRLLDHEGRPGGVLVPALRRVRTTDSRWWRETPLFRPRGAGISEWVVAHGKTYLSSDPSVPRPDSLGLDAEASRLLHEFAEHACIPLRDAAGAVVGTLHLARKERGSLAAALPFCEEAARLFASALARLDRQRAADFELSVLRAAGPPDVLDALRRFLGAAGGAVWPSGKSVGASGFRLVSRPDLDDSLRALCGPALGATPWRLDDVHQAAVEARAAGRREEAVYAVFAAPNEAISHRALAVAHRVLNG